MRYRPKRENYAIGQFGEIDYQEMLERYCTYLENKNKQLHLHVAGCSLPTKKDTMLFAIKHTKTEMPEFNETDKIIFRQGVLKMHDWISENKIKKG